MVHSAILFSDDLIFSSRISGIAKDLGAAVILARTPEMVVERAQREGPACVIVDLALAGERLNELLTALNELPRRPRVVAYGSHVDAAGLRAAVESGCDVVLPRSRFVEALPVELKNWIQAAVPE